MLVFLPDGCEGMLHRLVVAGAGAGSLVVVVAAAVGSRVLVFFCNC